MLISSSLIISIISIFIISAINTSTKKIKIFTLIVSIFNSIIGLFLFIIFDTANINFQFVQEISELKGLNLYIGLDGISIYFYILTTFITPLVLLSN